MRHQIVSRTVGSAKILLRPGFDRAGRSSASVKLCQSLVLGSKCRASAISCAARTPALPKMKFVMFTPSLLRTEATESRFPFTEPNVEPRGAFLFSSARRHRLLLWYAQPASKRMYDVRLVEGRINRLKEPRVKVPARRRERRERLTLVWGKACPRQAQPGMEFVIAGFWGSPPSREHPSGN
jgi:hypothetical protein